MAILTHIPERGAAEARRAHNPEDAGSKPAVAIIDTFFLSLLRVTLSLGDGESGNGHVAVQ